MNKIKNQSEENIFLEGKSTDNQKARDLDTTK